jgi:ATP-dependent RNA helicase DDX5/DBP2
MSYGGYGGGGYGGGGYGGQWVLFWYLFSDEICMGWFCPSGGGGYDNYGGGYGGDRMGALGSGLTKPKWDMTSLIKFEKNFYLWVALTAGDGCFWFRRRLTAVYAPLPSENKHVTARVERDVQEWRREKAVQVFGRNVPKPVTSFDEANFPGYINSEIKKAGFTEPSPIQCQAWPMALSGRDLVVSIFDRSPMSLAASF